MLVPSEPSALLGSQHKFPTMMTISDYPDVAVSPEQFNDYIHQLAKRFYNSQKAEEKIKLFYYPVEEELIEEEFADVGLDHQKWKIL